MNYYGYSKEELARAYSPTAMVGGDITPYLTAYKDLSAARRADMAVRENLRYGPAAEHVLDFFPASSDNAPLHVFIHGGYWQALSQKEASHMAAGVIAHGHAFATLNYTIAPTGRLGQMVEECRDALIWQARQSKDLGIDPSRIILSGHSAGGHLAAMVLSAHGEALRQAGITVTQAILISGVFDLEPIAQTPVNDALQLTSEEIANLSPMTLLPKAAQSVRVTVAERDTDEFIRQSRAYAERLRKADQTVSFDLQKGLHHFDIILHDGTFRPYLDKAT